MPWSANSNDDPSGLGRYLQRQHERLAAREAQVQAQLTAQYQATAQQIAPHVRAWADAYSRELQRVRAATGDPAAQVSEAWIREHLDGTLGQKLTRFVQAEVNRFADAAQADVTGAASDALTYGGQDAAALVTQALSPIAGALAGKGMTPGDLVNTVRGDALVGLESNWLSEAGDERLANIWFQYGDQASQDLYQLLHGAIRSGDNPNAVAPEIRNLLAAAGFQPDMEAISMSRALTAAWAGQMGRYLSQARSIARTEMLGAYRSAQLANYRANADVVKGWYWSAAIGACPVCCDLDGTFFPLDTAMDDCHVNCRCSPQPATSSWADILGPLGIDASDIPETSFEPQLGSDWFAEQGADYQRSILGPAAFNAYQQGDLTLHDLVGRTADGQYYQKSMKSLGLNAQQYLHAARQSMANSTQADALSHVAQLDQAAQARAAADEWFAAIRQSIAAGQAGGLTEEEARAAADEWYAQVQRQAAPGALSVEDVARAMEQRFGLAAAPAAQMAATESAGAALANAQQALTEAQAHLDTLTQQWAEKLAQNPYYTSTSSELDAAKWEVARAQAAVDAANGGRGVVINISGSSESPDAPFAQARFDAIAQAMFGRTLTRDEIGDLVGAPAGAYVEVFVPSGMDVMEFGLHGPSWSTEPFTFSEYDADRSLSLYRGQLVMNNTNFMVREDLQGSGVGAQIFSDEAHTLSDLGVRRIDTYAAGSGDGTLGANTGGSNGYYTWPRFGYAGKLPDDVQQALQAAAARSDVPASWGGYTTVQQLMRTPEGRDWWKANGESLALSFDLRQGSLSMRVLDAYVREKGQK